MEKVVVLSRILLCLSFSKSFTGRFLTCSSGVGCLNLVWGCLVISLVSCDLLALCSEIFTPVLEFLIFLGLGDVYLRALGCVCFPSQTQLQNPGSENTKLTFI